MSIHPFCGIAADLCSTMRHPVGLKDSKGIVAIDKDGVAPIFRVTGYSLGSRQQRS